MFPVRRYYVIAVVLFLIWQVGLNERASLGVGISDPIAPILPPGNNGNASLERPPQIDGNADDGSKSGNSEAPTIGSIPVDTEEPTQKHYGNIVSTGGTFEGGGSIKLRGANLNQVQPNGWRPFPSRVQSVVSEFKAIKKGHAPVTQEELNQAIAETKIDNPYGAHKIENVYYINLEKNQGRRTVMEAFLQNLHANTKVPYKRLEAKKGDEDVCGPDDKGPNFGPKCVGTSGLAYSFLHILDQENVTGPTMVLEDDYILYTDNFDPLYRAMEMLPDDWDIVRFDCWLMKGREYAKIINPYLINTTTATQTEECKKKPHCAPSFYGGTHAMLWRGRPSSIEKLRKTWSQKPMNHVDAQLSLVGGPQYGLISYCLNIGLGAIIKVPNEYSDIPKEKIRKNRNKRPGDSDHQPPHDVDPMEPSGATEGVLESPTAPIVPATNPIDITANDANLRATEAQNNVTGPSNATERALEHEYRPINSITNVDEPETEPIIPTSGNEDTDVAVTEIDIQNPPTKGRKKRRGNKSPYSPFLPAYPGELRARIFPSHLEELLSKYNAVKKAEYPLSLEQIKELKTYTTVAETYGKHPIENIYYNNLPKNGVRRAIMDTSLQGLQNKTGVPFKRLDAKRGDENVCNEEFQGRPCIGLSGLSYSLLHVLNEENVTGPTLVLEDDYLLFDDHFDRLYLAMDVLPEDWDIVRFDCWGMCGKDFASVINRYVINTTTYTPRKDIPKKSRYCRPVFSGGTHAMLFRGRPSSVEKLRHIWSLQPYDHVDKRIGTDGYKVGLISYCMNIGLGAFLKIRREGSDIPKKNW